MRPIQKLAATLCLCSALAPTMVPHFAASAPPSSAWQIDETAPAPLADIRLPEPAAPAPAPQIAQAPVTYRQVCEGGVCRMVPVFSSPAPAGPSLVIGDDTPAPAPLPAVQYQPQTQPVRTVVYQQPQRVVYASSSEPVYQISSSGATYGGGVFAATQQTFGGTRWQYQRGQPLRNCCRAVCRTGWRLSGGAIRARNRCR